MIRTAAVNTQAIYRCDIWVSVDGLLAMIAGLCEWNGLVSGWDNSPRWDSGPVDAVDLNAWLCLDQQTLAQMATLLGNPQAEIDSWWRQANHTAALMQRLLYDESSGLFLDWNSKTNKSVHVVTPATFFALLPGVATHAQALRSNFTRNLHLIVIDAGTAFR